MSQLAKENKINFIKNNGNIKAPLEHLGHGVQTKYPYYPPNVHLHYLTLCVVC